MIKIMTVHYIDGTIKRFATMEGRNGDVFIVTETYPIRSIALDIVYIPLRNVLFFFVQEGTEADLKRDASIIPLWDNEIQLKAEVDQVGEPTAEEEHFLEEKCKQCAVEGSLEDEHLCFDCTQHLHGKWMLTNFRSKKAAQREALRWCGNDE